MNLLKSGGKGMIWKIWVWKLVCAKFWDSELERLSILSRNQLEGTLGRPFKPGAIFCHFLIWINRPHPTHHSTMGMWGGGVASAFLSFSGNGRRVGDSYRASAVKAWGLVILLCRGNPILRDATTPRNPACDKELKHLWLTEDYIWGFEQKAAGLKKEGKIWASSQVFSTCSSFLSLPARSHSLSVCLSLNEHPPTISIQMVSSLQDSPQPARGLHQQNCQLWCWLGRGRVIGRIREDIPGKGTSTQWKRLDDGDAPGKHVLGIFCKEGKRKHRSTGHESTC